ncbi:MAG: phosphatidylglycerol lysyltransferase, partial [Spirochaeta sp.]
EVMAYAALEPELSGFIYISASHNPVGYNGFKIGGPGGGVFGGSAAAQLSEQLYTLAKSPEDLAACHAEFTAVSEREIASVLQSAEVWKEAALQAYHSWTDLIAFDRDDDIAASLSESIRMSPIGIVHDMNGSARCNSIDDKYLGSIGLQVHALHPGLRNFSHAIVPEGDSLLPCCHELAHVHAGNPHFLFGYVPDNDGDRGNLVVFDSNLFRARPVVAQEVFAIGVVAELSWLLYSGQLHMDPNGRLQERAAVVVNGPTSLRVDAICKLFDVEVYRAEVGEANVVELAEILRSKGYMVRILGEGSNGGTILHPARIRDPLNTLVSLVKFLRLPPNQAGLTPWKIWASRCGSETATADLAALLRSLPQYITTGAYEERAVLRGTTKDHAALKAAYEDLFLEYWQQRKNYLHDRFGFYTYKFFNTEGAEQRAGMGREYRSGDQSGGLTVLFKDDTGNPRGFFWMRGSKTEPVFRIMVDIDSNDPQDESDLFEDHRRLVEQANDKVIKLAET